MRYWTDYWAYYSTEVSLAGLGVATAALWAVVLLGRRYEDLTVGLFVALLVTSLIPGLVALSIFTMPLAGGGGPDSFLAAAAVALVSFTVSCDVAAVLILIGQRRNAGLAAILGPFLFVLGVSAVGATTQAAHEAIVGVPRASQSTEVADRSRAIALQIQSVDASTSTAGVWRIVLEVRVRSWETFVFDRAKSGDLAQYFTVNMTDGAERILVTFPSSQEPLPEVLEAGYDESVTLTFRADQGLTNLGQPSPNWFLAMAGSTTAGEVWAEEPFTVPE